MKIKIGILIGLIIILSLSFAMVLDISPKEDESAYIEPGLRGIDSASVDVIVTAVDIETASQAVAQVGGEVNALYG